MSGPNSDPAAQMSASMPISRFQDSSGNHSCIAK